MLLTHELNQKIEFARELYSLKFLNEKLEDEDDKKLRKEKLNKLLGETSDDKKPFKTK
jgi:hypothetical protein